MGRTSWPANVDIATFEPGFAKAPYTLTSLIDTAGHGSHHCTSQQPAIGSVRGAARVYTAGVPIVAGTDKAVPGHSVHRELELYVDAGLTPMHVIELATSGAAKAMGMAATSARWQRASVPT